MTFSTSDDFLKNLEKLQLHDTEVVRAFVAHYEPFIRRTLRFRIQNAALQSTADSMDICNSVLGGFLLRLAAGGYQLKSEEDLRKLLVSIAKKKFLMLNRKECAVKRDHHIRQSLHGVPELAYSQSDAVGARVEICELVQKVNQRMTAEECDLLNRRRNGQSWSEIEQAVGVDAGLLRKRLSRAIRRVADELGLDL